MSTDRIVPNNCIAPTWPKEQDAFKAGWEAAHDYSNHDWGPSPPDNPVDAKKLWENTCDEGHTIRIDACVACQRLGKASDKG